MLGPYLFDQDAIDDLDDDEYGVNLLTHEADNSTIIVVYVGRGIIKERLFDHLDDEKDALHFFYKPLDDEDDEFREECRLFHRYGETRAPLQRDPSRGASWITQESSEMF